MSSIINNGQHQGPKSGDESNPYGDAHSFTLKIAFLFGFVVGVICTLLGVLGVRW